MQSSYTSSHVLIFLTSLTFVTLTFLPNTFAQDAALENMVRLVYFLPSDRPARLERIAALREMMKDTQQFFADEMERHGYGRKTFTIETNREGEPVVRRVDGKFNEAYYYASPTHPKVREEVLEHFQDGQQVYCIAIDLSEGIYDDGSVKGTASVFVPPQESIILGGFALIPASDRYDSLRLTLHEMAHAFGLSHDFRNNVQSDEGCILYQRHFEKIENDRPCLSRCDAEWLSVNRFFNTKSISRNTPSEIERLSTPTSVGTKLRFRITDVDGLHQAHLLVPGVTGARLYDCKQLNGGSSTIEFSSEALTIDLTVDGTQTPLVPYRWFLGSLDTIVVQVIDVDGGITFAFFPTDSASVIPTPQVVSIPDPNLAAAIRTQLGLAPRAVITDQTLLQLTELDARERKIQDLRGLEHAPNLAYLYLSGNEIRSIKPLSGLTRLRVLRLTTNQIRDVRPLVGLPLLEQLTMGVNKIDDNGVERLANLTRLKSLDLFGNQIRDINPLARLTTLEYLSLSYNDIQDITPLAGLVNLKSLYLKGNPIQDTVPLASLRKLRDVDIEIPKGSGPTPIVHVESSDRPPLYWIDTDTRMLSRLVDSEVETAFIPSAKNVTSLAVDTTRNQIYWIERNEIKSASLDGSNVRILAALEGYQPFSLAIDTQRRSLYWITYRETVRSKKLFRIIVRSNLDGTHIRDVTDTKHIHENSSGPFEVVVDVVGAQLYWAADGFPKPILRSDLNGGNLQTIAIERDRDFRDIAISRNQIYWTNGFEIKRSSLDGSNVITLIDLETDSIVDIAVDSVGQRFYWTDRDGNLWRATLNGQNRQKCVSGLPTLEGSLSGGTTALAVGRRSGGTVDALANRGQSVPETPGSTAVVHVNAPAQRPPMYWVDAEAGTLHRLIGDEVENLIPHVQKARGLTIDPTAGTLYWTEKTGNNTGNIHRANLDGTNVRLIKELTSVPLDITLDTVGGKLYLTNSWGKIQRLNLDGSNFQSNLITDLQNPNHLVLDAARGKVYWTEQTGQATGTLRCANLNGTDIQLVKKLTSAPHGIAVDAVNQKLYLTNSWGKIQRLNFDGSNFQFNLITDLESPKGIAVDGVNRKLYWTENGGIRCANLNGENIQNVVTGLKTPASIVLSTLTVEAPVPAAPATVVIVPDETNLPPNYPNPFNPETWIPYQLAKPAEVMLHIYSVNRTLVRTLALGHQPAGIYHSRARAAYWDGKNEAGESVASGIYFYIFSAGDFTATRKMLIRK